MKQLLFTLFFMACSATAFANSDHTLPPPNTEPVKENTAAKKVKMQEPHAAKTTAVQPAKENHKKPSTEKLCAESSRFGISAYFVDFVHTSNLKLVKLLL